MRVKLYKPKEQVMLTFVLGCLDRDIKIEKCDMSPVTEDEQDSYPGWSHILSFVVEEGTTWGHIFINTKKQKWGYNYGVIESQQVHGPAEEFKSLVKMFKSFWKDIDND